MVREKQIFPKKKQGNLNKRFQTLLISLVVIFLKGHPASKSFYVKFCFLFKKKKSF